jgi:predicted metal-binding membrane protein
VPYNAREFARVRNPVLLISAVAWVFLLIASQNVAVHCPAMNSGETPLLSMAASWILMVAAMMSPVLIPPICNIRFRSLRCRRVRSTSLFVFGYALIWMAFGGGLMAMELAFKSFAPPIYAVASCAGIVALAWQCSPIKQRCLNRCHAHNELAAFGAAADLDAIRFGTTHGLWCAGSCWALMVFPMLLPWGHVPAMAIVSALVFSERLERPMPPSWRWRGFGRVIRIVIAQSRIWLYAHRGQWTSATIPFKL